MKLPYIVEALSKCRLAPMLVIRIIFRCQGDIKRLCTCNTRPRLHCRCSCEPKLYLVRAFYFVVALLFCLPGSAGAAQEENDGFFAATKIDDAITEELVTSLLNVYELYSEEHVEVFRGEEDFGLVDFFFASGTDYIVDQRVNERALPLFDVVSAKEIASLPTNSDVCYVQNVVLEDGQRLTLAIHNEDNDFAEDVYRCLVAGLWWHDKNNFEGFDGLEWRDSFSTLIGDSD